MALKSMAHSADDARNPLLWPMIASLVGHIFLFGIMFYQPDKKLSGVSFPGVINVQMVDMPSGAAPVTAAPARTENTAAPEKPALEAPVEMQPSISTTPQAEVSVAPTQPKAKTSLKYKTFKSQEVLKNTLQQLEQKVETSPPKPLEDTLQRLREQVAREGRPETTGGAGKGTGTGAAGAAGGPGQEGFGYGSKREGEAIDIYRLEVAYAINKNWAFAEQLAGGGDRLMASVVFKIMPDGKIEDIFFTDRSGNAYLDDSAMKAIVKSSPVKPHPPGLNRPYIEMGVRFTPKGVQ
jgi:colicin import membrane protein